MFVAAPLSLACLECFNFLCIFRRVPPLFLSLVVTCADGSSHRGSIVIGADGTRSKTRDLMRELALREAKSTTTTNERNNGGTLRKIQRKLKHSRQARLKGAATNPQHPFTSQYRMLRYYSPLQPHQKQGQARQVHGKDIAISFVSSFATMDIC